MTFLITPEAQPLVSQVGGPGIAPVFPAFVTDWLRFKNDRIDKIAQDLQGRIMDVPHQQFTGKIQLEWRDRIQEIQEVQKAPVNPEKSR